MFDVRVFDPFAASIISVPFPQLYRRNENEKQSASKHCQLKTARLHLRYFLPQVVSASSPSVFCKCYQQNWVKKAWHFRSSTLLALHKMSLYHYKGTNCVSAWMQGENPQPSDVDPVSARSAAGLFGIIMHGPLSTCLFINFPALCFVRVLVDQPNRLLLTWVSGLFSKLFITQFRPKRNSNWLSCQMFSP